MRFATVLVLGVLASLLWASTADAAREPPPTHRGRHFGECRRLTKQINRYMGVVVMAESRGDALWEESTLAHVRRLDRRREHLCPTDYGPGLAARFGRWLGKTAVAAGTAFLRYMTFGTYGVIPLP